MRSSRSLVYATALMVAASMIYPGLPPGPATEPERTKPDPTRLLKAEKKRARKNAQRIKCLKGVAT